MFRFGKPNVEKMEKRKNVKGLIKLLKYKKDVQVRKDAAEALGNLGDQRAVEPLIESLIMDSMALERLTELSLVIPEMTKIMDSLNSFRCSVENALGKIGDKRAVEPLIRVLSNSNSDSDSDTRVRWYAAEALGKIRDQRAVAPLIKALDDSYDHSPMKGSVKRALEMIGEPAIEPLIIALNDSDKKIREEVVDVLGMIGGQRAVEPLIKALNDSDKSVRWRATDALGSIGDQRAVEPLIKALNDSDKGVREKAAEVLGNIGDQRAVEPLIKALSDSDSQVYVRAAEALEKICDQRAIESLIKALNGNLNSYSLSRVIELLGMIGDQRAVQPLIQALSSLDWNVRRTAVETLEKLGWEPENDEISVKYWIAKEEWNKVVVIGTPAVEPLIKVLKDLNKNVIIGSVEALGKIRDQRAVEPLIKALNDSDKGVREKAAEALGMIGDQRAVKPLLNVLTDSTWEIRRAAATSLIQLYKDAKIDHEDKKVIFSTKNLIENPHTDESQLSDCTHSDSGIGLDFPI